MTDVHRSLYCSVSVWTCPLFLKLAITRRPEPHSLLQSTGRKISLRRARSSSSTKVQSDSAGARLLPQPTPFHTCVLCVSWREREREAGVFRLCLIHKRSGAGRGWGICCKRWGWGVRGRHRPLGRMTSGSKQQEGSHMTHSS